MEEKDNEKGIISHQPNYRGVKAMPFVIGNETFEKLGTIGSTSNLLVYLTTVFHMKAISATNLVNVFNGTCNFGTLVGAFLSDTYFGRYNTLGFASVSSFLGMLILAVTAASPRLHPPHCEGEESNLKSCTGPTAGQMAFLATGFGLLVVGAGGIRPCNLAFGADQFNPRTESGRKGVNSFFNWYYFTYTFAVLLSLTAIVYFQSNVSWTLGLAIPAVLMFLSCALFFAGSRMYVKVVPRGSPLTSAVRVMVAAAKKRRLKLPDHQPWLVLHNHVPENSINSELPCTDQFRFLNKAAIITLDDDINADGSAGNPWTLSTVQQVEEVKCILRVLPIWPAGMVYYMSVIQQQNYAVFQAIQSDRHLGGNLKFIIPAASYIIFSMLSLTIWIPIYDRIIVPWLRKKFTRREDGITLLQKMGTGMVLSVFCMLVSGFVERKRRAMALEMPTLGNFPGKGAISSMSGMWLVPQLVISGLSEAFTVIGENEFFYKQFPENMRSIAASFFFVSLAGSSYLSSFLSSAVQKGTTWLQDDLNKGRLDYFYYLIAALETLNLFYFLVCAKWYKYKGTGKGTNELAMDKI